MKILCLGNNSSDTDVQAHEIATKHSLINRGLITSLSALTVDGVYHTSLADISGPDLFSICEAVDRLIVLNQPIEQWDDPELFLLTFETAKMLQENAVLATNQIELPRNIEYFKTLVQDNKSFCVFPFIELIANNGNTELCCHTSKRVTTLENLTDWQTDPHYSEIRKDMIAGIRRNDYCSSCYTLENRNITSPRQQETVDWINLLGINSVNELSNLKSPVYYEVRPSNVCNLMCRMCGPQCSNLIYEEYRKLDLIEEQTFSYYDYDIIDLEAAKKIYIAGGEPTATPQLYAFLEKLDSHPNRDVKVVINTNAAKVSNKLHNLFSKFKNLSFIVSIDGFEKANDYIRHRSDWFSVTDNLKRLMVTHQVHVNITVTIYNIFSLHNLVGFLDRLTVPIHLQDGGDPRGNFSYNFIRGIDVLDNLTSIKNTRLYQTDHLVKSYTDGLITWARSSLEPNLVGLTKFFEFNDLLDNSRCVKLANYVPELEKYRNVI
jgi:hypothetical protein